MLSLNLNPLQGLLAMAAVLLAADDADADEPAVPDLPALDLTAFDLPAPRPEPPSLGPVPRRWIPSPTSAHERRGHVRRSKLEAVERIAAAEAKRARRRARNLRNLARGAA